MAVAETLDGRQSAVLRFETNSWRVLAMRDEKILRAWRAPDRSYWAASAERLVQFQDDTIPTLQTNEIPARQIFDVAVEPDGVFWLATSDGLFRHTAPLWRSPSPFAASLEAPVEALTVGGPGETWFVSGGALHRIAGEARQRTSFPTGFRRSGIFTRFRTVP